MNTVDPPLELQELKGWLIWKFEHVAHRKKPLKVPYYANNTRRRGSNGSDDDRENLVYYIEATSAMVDYVGVEGCGIAMMPEFNITALDFDNCVDEEGTILPEIEEMLLGTYVEYSPSGKGVRAFVHGNLGNHKSPTKDGQFGFELFNTKGYVTFTGKVTELTSLTDNENVIGNPSALLLGLIEQRFGKKESIEVEHNSNILGVSNLIISQALKAIPEDLPYNEWLQIGMAVHHETGGSEEGFILWDSWSANGDKYGSEEGNRIHWDSFGRQDSLKPVTIRSLIKIANSYGAGITLSMLTEDDFAPIEEMGNSLINIGDTGQNIAQMFKIHSTQEFIDTVKSSSWLIKDFLPKATLGVLYGESGSGKSFVVLDICGALTRGVDWNGLRCQKEACRVLYIVAEGVGGFSNRLRAYCHQAGINTSDFRVDILYEPTPNLMDRMHVSRLIDVIGSRDEPYDIIVCDTFAQMTPGANENSGEDMGLALGYCKELARHTGAMVLLVHHSGKDTSKGVRGWSGVQAAADVVLEVSRVENSGILKIVKQKDGDPGFETGFKLLPVPVGVDEEGDEITSCVVQYGAVEQKKRKLQSNQRIIYEAMLTFTPGSWVTEKQLFALYLEDEEIENSDREDWRKKAHFKTAIKSLLIDQIEKNDNNEYRIPS